MSDDPLTPDERDHLQGTLVERMDDAGCMPLDVVHGFFTATAVGAVPDGDLLDRALGSLARDDGLRGLAQDPAVVAKGKAIWDANCVACHEGKPRRVGVFDPTGLRTEAILKVPKKAKKALERLIEEFPESPYRSLAQRRLDELG
mgnify:CR=1 FL=1